MVDSLEICESSFKLFIYDFSPNIRFNAPFILLNDKSEASVNAICRWLSVIIAPSNILKANTVSGSAILCIVIS